ncbi:nucleoid-associated protein [Pseudomonas taiwanensis]|uniref:nucleoid-associated protein n=1 Tax=Pseudomonas taiwanensis TaxID=470150 RepID=UPI001649006F|nr:nucleoid-associated protein [Pseudomonas taiwanensis]MBC3493599.1 nucleoid-associated protein [Pseudomonas taiwanensis]
MSTFANLKFKRIILHNVHKPDEKGTVQPTLSQDVTNLSVNGKIKLQERVSAVLGSGSSSMEMDIADKGSNSCHAFAKQLIPASEQKFIQSSALIAKRHTEIHTSRQWPDGTLVIISGTMGIENNRCLIIIKAEQQAGFQEVVKKGRIVLDYLENLILTPQSKLYKIGVFFEKQSRTSGEPTTLQAHVFDSNIKANDDRQAARYFYSNFLGLKIPLNATQRTRDFFEYTTTYIDESDVSDDKKLDLKQALYTYLKVDQNHTIEISEFATKYLDKNMRDDYSDHMMSKGFPDKAISKDTKLINRKLARRKLTFTGSIKITGPSENFTSAVQILGTDGSSTTVKIAGNLIGQE